MNAEVIRLIEGFPIWSPAKHDGEPVYSYFYLPVKFKLE